MAAEWATRSAPATSREDHARYLENHALSELTRKLRLIREARLEERWPTARVSRLQAHVLEEAADAIFRADHIRAAPAPRAEKRIVVRWPR